MLYNFGTKFAFGFVVMSMGMTTSPVFADTTGFEEPIKSVFDWINEVFTEGIQDGDFDNDTKTNLQNTLDSGTDAGVKGTSLWFGIHDFFVNAIFAGTDEADLPVSIDLIIIVSMIAVVLVMFGLVYKLFKEHAKIALVIVAILIILGIVGITIEF